MNMEMNIAEACRSLTDKPLFATSAERLLILDELKSQKKELPQPTRFAWALNELLSRVSVPLETYDLIAGRCVDRELTEDEEQLFQAFIKHPDYPNKILLIGSGHCTYSWESVVELGLPGLRERALSTLARVETEEQRVFLRAMMDVYDAISQYMLRYAAAAKAAGMDELARSLTRGAKEKPQDFRTALQLLWIIALIVDYYCKHNLIMGRGEHQVGDEENSTTFQRICNFDAPQYLLLAGTDGEGNDAVNDLTLLFAECIEPSFKNPVVVVRYFKDMNTRHPMLWQTLMEKALSSASMMFYNDTNILSTYQRMGIPEEDRPYYSEIKAKFDRSNQSKEKIFDSRGVRWGKCYCCNCILLWRAIMKPKKDDPTLGICTMCYHR